MNKKNIYLLLTTASKKLVFRGAHKEYTENPLKSRLNKNQLLC